MRTITSLAAVLVVGSIAAQKIPDVRLDTDPPGAGESSGSQIAASGSSVYVVWQDNRHGNNDIFFNRSTDGGSTWLAADVRLDTDPAGSSHSFALNIAATESAVYVTWMDYRNGQSDIYFNASADGGVTWLSADVRLDTDRAGAAGSLVPRIASERSSVYVTWIDERNGASDIYFNHSTDGGASWLASDVRLDTDPAGAAVSRGPEIAVSRGTVYVTWYDERNGGAGREDIYLNYSADGGVTWLSSDVRLDTDLAGAASSLFPQIAVSAFSVYVTWYDERNGSGGGGGDIYFNYSADAGVTWLGSDIRLDTDIAGAAGSRTPKIAATGSSVYVAWTDERNGGFLSGEDIYFNYSGNGGASWLTSDVRLDTDTPGSARSHAPQITSAGTSVHVTWHDERNGGVVANDIYYNHSPDAGRTWLTSDVRLNTDSAGVANSQFPQIAASTPTVYVTWFDDRNGGLGGNDIYFNIPFGLQPYGMGTPGTGGLSPQLETRGRPTHGDVVALDVSNGLGGAAGAMFVGIGSNSKTALPVLGGTVLALPAVAVPVALTEVGTGSLFLDLPSAVSVIGVNVNLQGVFLDAGGPQGISMTNGIEMWIG